jgi:hypothetical protein
MQVRRDPAFLTTIVVLLAGAVFLFWTALQLDENLSNFQFGLLQIVYTYEEALPLLALGIALSRLSFWASVVSIGLFAFAFVAGQFLVTSLVPLLFPIDLVIGGIALVLPPPVNNWLVPVCSALVGFIVSVLTAYGSPEGAGWQSFVIGSLLTSCWLILLAFLIGKVVRQTWLKIASPILGSWLTAAGLLLGATFAMPKPPATPGMAVHPPAEIQQLPQP